jgi:hypothetical protein
VLTAMIMKSSVFWDMTPCSPLKVNQCFGGISQFRLHCRRISQARQQHEAGSFTCFLLHADFFCVMYSLFRNKGKSKGKKLSLCLTNAMKACGGVDI